MPQFKYDKKTIYIRAILINILVLFVLLVLFAPTTKSDDYDMTMVLYGAITNQYSTLDMYNGILFSFVVKVLLNILPNISWYYVLQYCLVFISLIIIYISLNDKRIIRYDLLIYCVYFFIGYECYIRMTFTKTAGIAIVSGFLALLRLINDNELKIKKIVAVCIWILFANSIRYGILVLVIEVFFSSFIITLFINENKQRTIKRIITFIIVVTILLIADKGTRLIHSSIIISNKEWKTYSEVNSIRARLQDYGMADYNKYEDEYNKIGMTYNDYLMYKKWAVYNDYDYYNTERLADIAEIEPIHGHKGFLHILRETVMNSLDYYNNETSFMLFSMVCCMFLAFNGVDVKRKILILFPIILCCYLAYIYMSFAGRLQHHVDLIVLIAGSLILMYYYESSIKTKYYYLIMFALFTFTCKYSHDLINESYYSDVEVENQWSKYKKNKEIVDLMASDKTHVYLFCALDTNILYDAIFQPFEVIPQGYYSNLAITNRYYIPDWDHIQGEYKINNYYSEATNSGVIYFVCTDDNGEWIDAIKQYINQHYCKDAYYIKVRDVNNVNVYRFVDDKK